MDKAPYKITLEKMNNEKIILIDETSFTEKKEANNYKKELMKRYNLIKHAGHIINYSNQIELYTNY